MTRHDAWAMIPSRALTLAPPNLFLPSLHAQARLNRELNAQRAATAAAERREAAKAMAALEMENAAAEVEEAAFDAAEAAMEANAEKRAKVGGEGLERVTTSAAISGCCLKRMPLLTGGLRLEWRGGCLTRDAD